jgi:hypothetical protein
MKWLILSSNRPDSTMPAMMIGFDVAPVTPVLDVKFLVWRSLHNHTNHTGVFQAEHRLDLQIDFDGLAEINRDLDIHIRSKNVLTPIHEKVISCNAARSALVLSLEYQWLRCRRVIAFAPERTR